MEIETRSFQVQTNLFKTPGRFLSIGGSETEAARRQAEQRMCVLVPPYQVCAARRAAQAAD
jgi:hypothetical protein